jgi:hypothetical protein
LGVDRLRLRHRELLALEFAGGRDHGFDQLAFRGFEQRVPQIEYQDAKFVAVVTGLVRNRRFRPNFRSWRLHLPPT